MNNVGFSSVQMVSSQSVGESFVCALCSDQDKPILDVIATFGTFPWNYLHEQVRYHKDCLSRAYAADPEDVCARLRAKLGASCCTASVVKTHVDRMVNSGFGVGTGVIGRAASNAVVVSAANGTAATPPAAGAAGPAPVAWTGLRLVGSVCPTREQENTTSPPKQPELAVAREAEIVRSYEFEGRAPRESCKGCGLPGAGKTSAYVVFSTSRREVWYHRDCAHATVKYDKGGKIGDTKRPMRLFAAVAREFPDDDLSYDELLQNIFRHLRHDVVYDLFKTNDVSAACLILISEEIDRLDSKDKPETEPSV